VAPTPIPTPLPTALPLRNGADSIRVEGLLVPFAVPAPATRPLASPQCPSGS
jgi:hypothetical protein